MCVVFPRVKPVRSLIVIWVTATKLIYLSSNSINPFYATGLFLYLPKTSENLWFSDNFTGLERVQCYEMGFKTLERHVRNSVWGNCKWQEKKLGLIIFFLIGIHSMQGWTDTTSHGVTRKKKRTKKITGYRKSV